jgi:hypothetical protein
VVESLDLMLYQGSTLDRMGCFSVKDGVVSVPVEWTAQVDPSYPLTDEQLEAKKDRPRFCYLPLKNARAYFTEEDFREAFTFYQIYWPPGSSIDPMVGQIS